MIQISCTRCKTLLTIDEAFAGGVCRCQHCGTIQTVPSHLRDPMVSSGTIAQAASARARAAAAGTPLPRSEAGTGLDRLAESIAGSGLTGSGLTGSTGLRSGRLQRAPLPTAAPASPAEPANYKLLLRLLILSGVIIAVLLIIILWLLLVRR